MKAKKVIGSVVGELTLNCRFRFRPFEEMSGKLRGVRVSAKPAKKGDAQSMIRSRWLAYLVVSFVLTGTLLYPNRPTSLFSYEASASETIRTGGIYRIPLLNEPPRLDPATVEDIYGVSLVQQLFEGLVQYTPDLLISPALAQNWVVEDNGKLYRFFLRPKVTFHNGRILTARDVVFSLTRLISTDPPPSILPHLLKIKGASDYREGKTDRVIGLEARDDLTVTIQLEEPYTPFLTALGMYQAKIVPQEDVKGKEEDFARHPIGNGPFRLASWESNKTIRLERFPAYYGGPSYLDGIDFKIYPGGKIEEVLQDFEAGNIEEMPVYGQIRDRVLKKREVVRIHRPSLSLLFYGMNCKDSLLSDVRVRKALAWSVDRKRIVSEVYTNQFQASAVVLPPGMPGYQPEGKGWPHDMEAARRSLIEALGEKSNKKLTVEVVSNSQSPLARAELDLIGQGWKELGIEMIPRFIPDWAEFEKYLKSGSFQLYRYAWFADMPDPDNFLQPLLGSDSQINFMGFKDPDLDATLAKARTIGDPIERTRLYQRVEGMVAESCPIIPLFYLSVDRVYHPWVHGIEASPLGEKAVSYHRVWLEKTALQ